MVEPAVSQKGSSGSDSDFEDIDASPEDIKALETLRSALVANPRQYDVHCQVITPDHS